jgi:hypothetical protein
MTRMPLVERAFELARSGQVPNVEALARKLKREQYEQVDAHLDGSTSLRRELNDLCRNAWAAAGNKPVALRGRYARRGW